MLCLRLTSLVCLVSCRVVQSGGPFYEVELGRLDGLSSSARSVAGKLPNPNHSMNQLIAIFRAHGLTMSHLVALSGDTHFFFF